jgi:hypothetical protein
MINILPNTWCVLNQNLNQSQIRVISQETELFITTAARTSNPTTSSSTILTSRYLPPPLLGAQVYKRARINYSLNVYNSCLQQKVKVIVSVSRERNVIGSGGFAPRIVNPGCCIAPVYALDRLGEPSSGGCICPHREPNHYSLAVQSRV